MKKDMEYNSGQEFEALPDEYLQGGGNNADSGKKKDKSSRKKMLYLAVVFSVAAYVASGTFDFHTPVSAETVLWEKDDTSPAEEPETTKEPKPADGQGVKETEPEASSLPESNLADASENNGSASLPIYPVEDGTSYYVVYNDTYGTDNEFSERILEEGFVFESQLAQGIEFTLPEYEPVEGYLFMGWVVYYDKANKSAPSMGMIGDSLNAGNVCFIKPENGSRYIEVHAAWRRDGVSEWPYLLTLDANGGRIEGEQVVTYDAAGPMGSGCYVYLCAYPVPVRDGYTFTGWYTEPDGGSLETRLQGIEFYEKKGDEFDWSTMKQVTLYAGWVKN